MSKSFSLALIATLALGTSAMAQPTTYECPDPSRIENNFNKAVMGANGTGQFTSDKKISLTFKQAVLSETGDSYAITCTYDDNGTEMNFVDSGIKAPSGGVCSMAATPGAGGVSESLPCTTGITQCPVTCTPEPGAAK